MLRNPSDSVQAVARAFLVLSLASLGVIACVCSCVCSIQFTRTGGVDVELCGHILPPEGDADLHADEHVRLTCKVKVSTHGWQTSRTRVIARQCVNDGCRSLLLCSLPFTPLCMCLLAGHGHWNHSCTAGHALQILQPVSLHLRKGADGVLSCVVLGWRPPLASHSLYVCACVHFSLICAGCNIRRANMAARVRSSTHSRRADSFFCVEMQRRMARFLSSFFLSLLVVRALLVQVWVW